VPDTDEECEVTTRPTASARVRAGILPAVALAIGVLVSACGGPIAAQSAAILGDEQVSAAQLDAYVTDLYRATDRPVDEQDPVVVRDTLERLIVQNLVNQAAGRLGITLTQTEIDQRTQEYVDQFGGRAAMDEAFAASGIAPSGAEAAIRLSLLVPKIGAALVPDGAPEAQQQAVVDYMSQVQSEIGVDVNPRYGTWASADFRMGPLPDDLSVPLVPVDVPDPLAPQE
jgi:hypothetical protein